MKNEFSFLRSLNDNHVKPGVDQNNLDWHRFEFIPDLVNLNSVLPADLISNVIIDKAGCLS